MKKILSFINLCLFLSAALLVQAQTSKDTPEPAANELAKWLAGQPNTISDNKDAVWKAHAGQITKAWEARDKRHFQVIDKWQAEQLKDTNERLFYPFGGPDVAHAIAMFPNAKSRVLFGLEPIGSLANPIKDNATKRAAGLKSLHQALSGVLGRNFFKTLDMGKEVGSSPYHGVTAIALFFLASQGQTIETVSGIKVDANGEIIDVPWDKADGVQISHRKGNQYQTLLYFSWDISDAGLGKHPERVKWLKNQKNQTTFLKAASYLNWRPDFDTIRSFILNQSHRVVTDSSGMPYEAFEGWNISLYGKYNGPIKLFSGQRDAQLIKAFEVAKYQPLPFLYGYGGRNEETHVIVANRITPISELVEYFNPNKGKHYYYRK